MKIEKLELKHICGYLPWGLTGYHKEGHICNIDFDMVVKYGTNLANYKPLLFPLSALIEQLPDGTVPIVELAKICTKYEKLKLENTTTTKNGYWIALSNARIFGYIQEANSFCMYDYKDVYTVSNQLQLFEYLYSKHFDIYGLIDAGLAIDKRTVKL